MAGTRDSLIFYFFFFLMSNFGVSTKGEESTEHLAPWALQRLHSDPLKIPPTNLDVEKRRRKKRKEGRGRKKEGEEWTAREGRILYCCKHFLQS